MRSPLLVKDLVSFNEYAREHEEYRAEVISHRGDRTVKVGHIATLLFQDDLTVRYQIQESLRVKGLSDDAAIQAEIDACSPLIPDGSNLKATFTIDLPNGEERHARVAKLVGIESRVWLQVEGSGRIFAVSEAEMQRPEDDEDETSAVHFLRFEFAEPLLNALKEGNPVSVGIDHPAYTASLVLGDKVRESLQKDLR